MSIAINYYDNDDDSIIIYRNSLWWYSKNGYKLANTSSVSETTSKLVEHNNKKEISFNIQAFNVPQLYFSPHWN
jgi:hypothetical protein